jgi:hypothetical protein
MRQPGVPDHSFQNLVQRPDLIMNGAARWRLVALARLDAVYPVILDLAGRDLAEPNIAEKRQQMQPQTDLMPLGPFLCPLALGDKPVFHRKPLGGKFERLLIE